MKFKFIGADGSMGLKKGEVYELKTSIISGILQVRWRKEFCCPYSSLEKFLENWERSDT